VRADLIFEGSIQMPRANQEQIAASIKQRSYSGDLDEVTDEVLERVKWEWQDRGYFKVQVQGNSKVLTSNPIAERISITVHVDEGQQYRLSEIAFKNNKAISDVKLLRGFFPIRDGGIFQPCEDC
jgi:outer membrane protein assembly factor BamA